MTEGSMTGRPYGGVNEKPDDSDVLPGERPDHDEVEASPEQEPRAARGGMSGEATRVPEGGAPAGSDAKAPGITDATGPTG